MNILLLITVTCTLALVYGQGEVHNTRSNSVLPDYNRRPCERNSDNNAYNRFARKHILKKRFDVSSDSQWRRYLQQSRLCNRRFQSFVRGQYESVVQKICNGHGLHVSKNLCISTFRIQVFDIRVTNTRNCRVQRGSNAKRYVIVACDKVENHCLPVHFDATTHMKPTSGDRCQPRAHDWFDV